MRLHKTSRPPRLNTSLALAVLLTAACSRTHTDTTPPEKVASHHDTSPSYPDRTPPQPVKETPPPPPVTTETSPQASVETPADFKITDDEIFGVLEMINNVKIEEANLAKKWAKDQRVKRYAATLIREHNAANKRQKELRGRLGLLSSDSRLRSDVKSDSDQKITKLKEIGKGDAFDASFVDTQIQSNTLILDFIDNKLLPNTQMPDLREELGTTRATVEGHMNAARDLQGSLKANKT